MTPTPPEYFACDGHEGGVLLMPRLNEFDPIGSPP